MTRSSSLSSTTTRMSLPGGHSSVTCEFANGKLVVDKAQLPGLPEKGRLALQHHGTFRDGRWMGPPSLVQFRNIYIKEL